MDFGELKPYITGGKEHITKDGWNHVAEYQIIKNITKENKERFIKRLKEINNKLKLNKNSNKKENILAKNNINTKNIEIEDCV